MFAIKGIRSFFIFLIRQAPSEPCLTYVGESGQPQKMPFPQHVLPHRHVVVRQRNRRKLLRKASTLRRSKWQ